ncbi:MAG: radical SAM protein [Planctomycetes bacterium]|nr:radical SAM protein [Planctomycetota bacterium]
MGKLGARELLVNEIFHSIQGESTHTGRPCTFIRLTGCHLRCVWCDSEYAFFEGSTMTVGECIARAEAAGCPLVEVTGGEPLLQLAVYPLMAELCDRGFEVLLETSGAVGIERVDPRVKRIVDWKCPGSGMDLRNKPAVLESLRPGDELKLVLADRRDYEWARAWLEGERPRLPAEVPVHFSPAFGQLRAEELARWILDDRLPVRLNLQLHKWIWEPGTRGV